MYNQAIRIVNNMIEESNLGTSYKLYDQPMSHLLTYNIPIYAADLKTEVSRLWFLENGKWGCMGAIGRDCIRRDQIEWFREQSNEMPQTNKFRQNGIAFMHTPLQEHMTMVNNYPVHGQRRDYTEC